MSGECDDCGEHCLECRCWMIQGDGIKIWMQIFFEDGSVTKGSRFPAEWLDDPDLQNVKRLAESLLQDVNRDEGWVLIWGAGNMLFKHYPTSFYPSELSESDS